MSLRLIWAGPWNRQSAIGFFGTEVVAALIAQGHWVDVFRTELGQDLLLPAYPTPGLIDPGGGASMSELLQGYDGVIVNLGNHYGFHGAAVPLLWKAMPLVIFHDAWMGDFVRGWRHVAGDDAWRIDRLLQGAGDDGSGIALFSSLGSGAVVHGVHYRAAVEASCPGPVAIIPLSYTFQGTLPRPEMQDPLVVATIGHVNRNKQVREVIRALGASERLKERVFYLLIGPVEPDEQASLLALAREVGAPEPHFTGWVPDEMLRILMAGTHVFCCLRYPAYEGGSASMITCMLSGRPTIVSNHASYGEIPEGYVLKCSPGEEATDVRRHLETILEDPAAAFAMGERARQYALERFAPTSYAAELQQALALAIQASPAVRAGRLIGQRLGEIGMRPGDPAVARMGDALRTMCSHEGKLFP